MTCVLLEDSINECSRASLITIAITRSTADVETAENGSLNAVEVPRVEYLRSKPVDDYASNQTTVKSVVSVPPQLSGFAAMHGRD